MARSTLYRDLLFFLKGTLTTNITDPVQAARGSSSAFVMTSYPEREVKYPLITLEIVNTEERRAGMQTTAMDVRLTVEVRVWSKSVAQADKLTQNILDHLADIQFTADGSIDNNFHDFNITSTVPMNEPGKGALKSRIIQINYSFFNV